MLVLSHASGGVSRRNFLRVGSLAWGGLSLAEVLRCRASAAGTQARPKSVVMIHLSGGPSHLDTYDMKPLAPAEYRGEFQPIATNVPGIEICELMPMSSPFVFTSAPPELPWLIGASVWRKSS